MRDHVLGGVQLEVAAARQGRGVHVDAEHVVGAVAHDVHLERQPLGVGRDEHPVVGQLRQARDAAVELDRVVAVGRDDLVGRVVQQPVRGGRAAVVDPAGDLAR